MELWKGKNKNDDNSLFAEFTENIMNKQIIVDNTNSDISDKRIVYYMKSKESVEIYCKMMSHVFSKLNSLEKSKLMQTWYLCLFTNHYETNKLNWRKVFFCMVLLSKNEGLLKKMTKEIQLYTEDKTEKEEKILKWALRFFINGNQIVNDLKNQFLQMKRKKLLDYREELESQSTHFATSASKEQTDTVTLLEEKKMKKRKVKI